MKTLFELIVSIQKKSVTEPYYALSKYVNALICEEETPGLGWPFDSFDSSQYEPLSVAVEALKKTRYSDVRQDGSQIRSESAEELNKTDKAFKTFAEVVFQILQTGIDTAIKTVCQDVYEGFSECADIIQQKMSERCTNEEALQEFSGLLHMFDKKYPLKK